MLTNKQCIEVADKVWGWKKRDAAFGLPEESRPIYWYEPTEKKGQLVLTFSGYQLKDEVNSWSGFGRTVEAMRGHLDRGQFFADTRSAMGRHLDYPGAKESEFFEEVHLAALEALNENTNIS